MSESVTEKQEDPVKDSSVKLREMANKQYQEGRFETALAIYNQALLKSDNDAVEAALCYANRAAIYLELKFYQHCIHNLDLAEPNYPRDKIQKLQDRRQRCEREMKTLTLENIDMAEIAKHTPYADMFKLSYDANPKLQFFIDAVELREDSNFERHLATRQELKAGDVIGVLDDSIVMSVEGLSVKCFNCLKNNDYDLVKSNRFGGGEFKTNFDEIS